MDVPIEIAGLGQVIDKVPGGSLIVIKGGPDPIKSYFAQMIGVSGARSGLKVSYIPSYGEGAARRMLMRYFNDGVGIDLLDIKDPGSCFLQIQANRMLVVDSFSYLAAGRLLDEMRSTLETIKKRLRETSSVAVLVLTGDMLTPQMEAMIMHHADGIILLLEKETSEGVKRYLRIPRWADGISFDLNIFYAFNDNKVSVDTRYRVV